MISNTSICKDYLTCNNIPYTSACITEDICKNNDSGKDTEEARKFWEMIVHCEITAFRRVAPNLRLPSREAHFYWHLYVAAAKHFYLYQNDLNHALRVTLSKLRRNKPQEKIIYICDQLVRLNTFDYHGRRSIISELEQLFREQKSLESISLEGLSLSSDEGVRLLLALYNSRKTMKYVYCWRAFKGREYPLLPGTVHSIRSRFCMNRKTKKCDWFRAIGCFENLTVLSVNYEYIATPTGNFLINLSKKLAAKWQWLQILYSEKDIPRRNDLISNDECPVIPDDAWIEIQFWAPALKVQFAIIGIPQYDRHKRLFTKNTPVHTFAISTNIDLKFQQPWFLDCTIKTLCHWYENCLVDLYLQFWHHRENLDNQLSRLFVNLPSLQVFGFVGEIRKLQTFCAMCCQIQARKCNVRDVNIQLQEIIHAEVKGDKRIKDIECLLLCFKRDFDEMDVKFNVGFYSS